MQKWNPMQLKFTYLLCSDVYSYCMLFKYTPLRRIALCIKLLRCLSELIEGKYRMKWGKLNIYYRILLCKGPRVGSYVQLRNRAKPKLLFLKNANSSLSSIAKTVLIFFNL